MSLSVEKGWIRPEALTGAQRLWYRKRYWSDDYAFYFGKATRGEAVAIKRMDFIADFAARERLGLKVCSKIIPKTKSTHG